MIEPNTDTATEQAVTPAPESLPLADYRAWRTTGAVAPPSDEAETQAATETPEEEESDSPESEPAGESEPPEPTEQDGTESKPAKKKGGFQKTIEKLRSENEQLKARLAGPPAAPAAQPQPVPPAQAAEPQVKPKMEDFESLEAFQEALIDFKADERARQQAEIAARQQAEQAQRQKVATFQDRAQQARTKHSDFDAALESTAHIAVPQAIRETLLESEQGAELAYWLAKRPAELERISRLHPLAQAHELGRIAAAFPSQPTAQTQKPAISKAPAPIRTVGSQGTSAKVFDISKASASEYRRYRAQQQGKKAA